MRRFVTLLFLLSGVFALNVEESKAAPERNVVIEEFTSTTCGPCVAADPVMAEVVVLEDGVFSVRYHMPWPDPGNDALYAANPTDNDARRAYYGVNAIPNAQINGKVSLNPIGATAQIKGIIDQAKANPFPVTITVKEDRSDLNNVKVDVTVVSDVALSNYTLQTAVVSRHIKLPAPGTNGQTEVEDAMLKMLPNGNGSAFSTTGGEEKKFSFTYKMGSGPFWLSDQGYVIAFLQDNTTKEIIQAGTNYIFPTTKLSSNGDAAKIAAVSEASNFQVNIQNISEQNLTYEMTVSKSDRTPANWDVIVSSPVEFTVAAGQQTSIDLSLVPGATVGIGDAVVVIREKGNPNSRTYTQKVTVLSKEAEKVSINMEEDITIGSVLENTGHASFIDITGDDFNAIASQVIDSKQLKYVVWNGGQKGGINNATGFALSSFAEQGVRILVTGQVAIPLLASTAPNNPFLADLGISWVGDIMNVSTFDIVGYTGDPITNGMVLSAALIPGGYFAQELRIENTDIATPMLRFKDVNRVIATRSETDDTRIVMIGINPDIISDQTKRGNLIDKSMDWLESFSAAPKPKLVSSIDLNQTISFGKVKVGESQEKIITFSAGSDADLQITDFSDFSGTFGDNGLTMTGLPSSFPETPITLKKGETLTVTLKYAPTAVGTIEDARLSIGTNDPNNEFFLTDISGEATPNTTSVGEVMSASGELSVNAGPNPFVNTSVVRYTVHGTTAKVVRVSVYNELGQEVAVLANDMVTPGTHTAEFNGATLPAGLYHVVMATNGEKVTLPVVHVK